MMQIVADIAPAARDALLDAWTELVERHGLSCAGGSDAEQLTYVVTGEGAQATESDRVAVLAWLSSRTELLSWRMAELEDLSQGDRYPSSEGNPACSWD